MDEVIMQNIREMGYLLRLPAKIRDNPEKYLELNIDMRKRFAWLKKYKSSHFVEINIPYRALLEEFCLEFECWRKIYIGFQLNQLYYDMKCEVDIIEVEYVVKEVNNDSTIKAIEKCNDDQTCILLEQLLLSPKNIVVYSETHVEFELRHEMSLENTIYLYYMLYIVHSIADVYKPKKMIRKEGAQRIFFNYATNFWLDLPFIYVLTDFQIIGNSRKHKSFIELKSGPVKLHTIYEVQEKKYGKIIPLNDYIAVTSDRKLINFLENLDNSLSSRDIFDNIINNILPDKYKSDYKDINKTFI